MTNKIFSITMIIVATIFSGCSSAPKSSEVNSKYVPATNYTHLSCDQLFIQAEGIRRSVPALATAVDKHRSNQDGVELVTWLLFWPAAFALDKGEATSSQLAQAKGELEAINLAMMSKNCNGDRSKSSSIEANNGTQPSNHTPPTNSIDKKEIGKDSFTVEKIARANSCTHSPLAKVIANGAGFETYSVQCDNGDITMYRCEYGNCRLLK